MTANVVAPAAVSRARVVPCSSKRKRPRSPPPPRAGGAWRSPGSVVVDMGRKLSSGEDGARPLPLDARGGPERREKGAEPPGRLAGVELRPAYLIAGSDWPKVDQAIARLRARFPEEAVEQLAATDE